MIPICMLGQTDDTGNATEADTTTPPIDLPAQYPMDPGPGKISNC